MMITTSQKSKLLSEFIRLNIVSSNSKEADDAWDWFNTFNKKIASDLIDKLSTATSKPEAEMYIKGI